MLEPCGVALDDVDEVFFHLLDVLVFIEMGDDLGGFFVEPLDVGEDHLAGHDGGSASGEGGPELLKDPRVTDRTPADHEAGGFGGVEVGEAGLGVDDVSVGDDGAGHLGDGAADPVIVHGGLVAFFDGAAMDGEEVDGVFFEDVEEYNNNYSGKCDVMNIEYEYWNLSDYDGYIQRLTDTRAIADRCGLELEAYIGQFNSPTVSVETQATTIAGLVDRLLVHS